MRSRRTLIAAGLLAFAALAGTTLAACGSDEVSSTTDGSTTPAAETTAAAPSTEAAPDTSGVTLTVGVSTTRGKGRQAIRLASKAFEGTPYTLKWAEFANGDAAMQALTSGAIDVILELQPSNAVIAAGNAKEPWTEDTRLFSVVAAVRYVSKQGVQLVVRPDSGIETVAQMKGKSVGYSKGSNTEYFWSLLAKQENLTKSDTEEIKTKFSEAKTAFLAGHLDGLLGYDYTLMSLVRTGKAKVLASSGDLGLALYTLMVARQGVLDDAARRAAVADLVLRNEASEAWAVQHVAEARKIWEDLDGVDPLDSEQLVLASVVEPVTLVPEVVAAVQDQIEVFFARGEIEQHFDAHVLFDVVPVA